MLQTATHQAQVIIAQDLYVISNNAAVTAAVLHEVDFKVRVPVQWICMLFLVTFNKMVAVFLGQRSYLGYYITHSYWG